MPGPVNQHGYSAGVGTQVSGATQRQLDYWDKSGLVPASLNRDCGKGNARCYSYTDLLKLRVVVELRQVGVSLQKIRKALKIINKWDPDSDALLKKKLFSDGKDIYVTTSDKRILKSILRRGQLAFSVVLVGKVVKSAAKAIYLYDRARQATG